MRKILACVFALALTGCAWLGFGDDSETVAANEPETMASEPAVEVGSETSEPVAEAPKKSARTTRGAKSEAQIKAELDAMGKRLAAQSGRTLLPNRSKPDYKQVGGEWVASFIDVDTSHVTTEMRPGANGQYVGFIRYQERFMECRGKTKQGALNGSCTQVKTRNLNELIRYDGKAWQD
ncbi:MAG: translation initiation factor 2 [Desulfovibrio sp.]|nr:translation initiation factor 2 [Desulfovibrio sp.]